MKPRNAFDHSRSWPVCYRCEEHSDLPRGPIDEPVRGEAWFWFACLWVLIVMAPAVVELIA